MKKIINTQPKVFFKKIYLNTLKMNLMKFLAFILLICMVSSISAQSPKSTKYKRKNDFMVAVLCNPTFSLFDFISIAKMHERNTQFLDESKYTESNFIISKCKELYGSFNSYAFHITYMKVKAAWEIFLEIQNTDVSYNGMGKYFVEYDMFDTDAPRSCPYPELKYQLSIIPLRLEEY